MDLLYAMAVFTRVAELASFTQAAQALGAPKASVSLAVQRLEAELGTRLLHRTTRRVQLTQDGLALYERAKDLLTDVDELRSLFRPSGSGVSGRLRVDMPLGAARNLLVPRLPEFLAAHPGLAIELGSTDRRVDVVREGFFVGALGSERIVHVRQRHHASAERNPVADQSGRIPASVVTLMVRQRNLAGHLQEPHAGKMLNRRV